MKIMNQNDLNKITAEGVKGTVDVMDAVNQDGLVAGVRVVAPNSLVPNHGHKHKERQLNYLISGRCEIFTTDENEKVELKPGDFIYLDPFEPHYFRAFDTEAVLFEVRYP